MRNPFLAFLRLQKILSDGINPQGMAEIAVHLCWENEDMSRKVIKEICSGIDLVDSDRFKPYFEVLSQVLALQDSLHPKRYCYRTARACVRWVLCRVVRQGAHAATGR